MTKRQYQIYSILFFFFSIIFSGFLISAFLTGSGFRRIISVSLFGFLIFTQLRVAILMYKKSREADLK